MRRAYVCARWLIEKEPCQAKLSLGSHWLWRRYCWQASDLQRTPRHFTRDHGRFAMVAITSQPSMSWEPCMRRMSRPVRRARSTDCTINSWQAVNRLAIGIPHPNIDRAVSETDFFRLARGCFLFVEAQT